MVDFSSGFGRDLKQLEFALGAPTRLRFTTRFALEQGIVLDQKLGVIHCAEDLASGSETDRVSVNVGFDFAADDDRPGDDTGN